MTRRNLSEIVRYLRMLGRSEKDGSGASDAELLERYVCLRDEAAFELLLWRHGALVFNVCRRILPRPQDAEDAFQATFLAFVRKAPAIVRRGSVAGWLYKVAYRVALAAKARARNIADREKPGAEAVAASSAPEAEWKELRPILDEEVNRLPERLRQPFVLCYLEGKTNEEAARQLGCPAGTIFSRLARGRELLRKRLRRRGVTLSIAGLTAALTAHAVEAAPTALLLTTTVRSALLFAARQSVAGVSTQATALAEGVLRAMFVSKLKMTALVLAIAGMFAVGGVATRHVLNAATQPENPPDKVPVQAETPRDKDDKKPFVSVVHPTPGGLQRTTRYSGHVRASAQQEVYAVVSGILKQLRVDIGGAVYKGDVLAEIDAPLLAADYQQAKAALALEQKYVQAAKAQVVTAAAEQKAAVDRIKHFEAKVAGSKAYLEFRKKQQQRYAELLAARAIDAKMVDEQENQLEAARQSSIADEVGLKVARSDVVVRESNVSSAKAALEIAEAKQDIARLVVEKAKAQMDFTYIRANFDGIVTQRNVNPGEIVFGGEQGPRRSLLTVLRTDPVRVVVEADEAETPFLRRGLPVKLASNTVPALAVLDCKVSRVGFAINENTGTMPVEIDVPNPKNLLRPGMFIWATIQLDQKAPVNAVTVPTSTIVQRKGQAYVYVVHEGEVRLTPIQMTLTDGDKTEIASGVGASDRLVVDPSHLQDEVVPIKIRKAP